jgi:G3E family GTPase
MTRDDGRMRMTVLGGYLGSGKTTWLRHQLHHGEFKDALVIVNEAAETPVDAAILGDVPNLAMLVGGCVCCEAQGELVHLLRNVCDARSGFNSSDERLQRIVLETSGLADPRPIVEAVRNDSVLVHHIVVSEIIVAVDALHALEQLRSERLGRAQMEVADRLVVTKIDAAQQAALTRLLATLRGLNPGAVISGAARGSVVSLPAYDSANPEPLSQLSDETGRSPLFATKLALDPSIDWTAFSVWLSALLHARGEDVLRVKGVARTPAGRMLLQSVRKTVQSPEVLPERDEHIDNVMVVIGRGYRAEDLRRSLEYFAAAGRTPDRGPSGAMDARSFEH